MRITISGVPGSGKSTAGKALAKKLGYEFYSTGDFAGKLAQQKGMTIDELSKAAKKNPEIDKQIDQMPVQLADKDNIVVDSRMAWHFIEGKHIFLKVDLDEAAKRIFKDAKEGKRKDEPEYKTAEQVKQEIQQRMKNEQERYEKLYGVNHLDESNYDIVIDTTGKTVEQTLQEALAKILST